MFSNKICDLFFFAFEQQIEHSCERPFFKIETPPIYLFNQPLRKVTRNKFVSEYEVDCVTQ